MSMKKSIFGLVMMVTLFTRVGESRAAVIFSETFSGVVGSPIDLGSDNYSEVGTGIYSLSTNIGSFGWTTGGGGGGGCEFC